MFNFWAHGFCAFHYEGSLRPGSRMFGEYKSLFTEIKRDLFIIIFLIHDCEMAAIYFFTWDFVSTLFLGMQFQFLKI